MLMLFLAAPMRRPLRQQLSTCIEWSAPPSAPSLENDDVHVWAAILDASEAEHTLLEPWLSVDEIARAARFRFDRDRRRFVVRRAVLRALIGQYIGIHPASVTFSYTSRGKPQLAPPVDVNALNFSLSYSQNLGLFAFKRNHVIGVDVEWTRPLGDANTIASRFFSAAENKALHAVSPAQRMEAFYNCWTRKEAFIKATGEGLQRSLDTFDVALIPGEPVRLLHCADCNPSDWSLLDLRPANGYIGAVAAPGSRWRVRRWQWSAH
jgi:4'-phosphopantetheinyl transferase